MRMESNPLNQNATIYQVLISSNFEIRKLCSLNIQSVYPSMLQIDISNLSIECSIFKLCYQRHPINIDLPLYSININISIPIW